MDKTVNNYIALISKMSDNMTMTDVKVQVPIDMVSYVVTNDCCI